jgi:hypothetical protein
MPPGAAAPENLVPTRAATHSAPPPPTTTQRRRGRAGKGARRAESHLTAPERTNLPAAACLNTTMERFRARIPAAPILGAAGLRRQPPQGTAREGGARRGGGGGGGLGFRPSRRLRGDDARGTFSHNETIYCLSLTRKWKCLISVCVTP